MKPLINVRVEATMKAKLEIIADRSSLSLPNLLQLCFLEYITRWEKEHGKISHEDVNKQQL